MVARTSKQRITMKSMTRDEEARKIAKHASFCELTESYTHKYYQLDQRGMRTGDETTEIVSMSDPRPCVYHKKYYYDNWRFDDEGVYLADLHVEKPPITREVSSSSIDSVSSSDSLPVEHSGITLRQLRAVAANVERRCVAENWTDFKGNPLTPDKVTLYDINKYVILPFTVHSQTSFVAALPSTAGPQPPRWFLSHWWGEPAKLFLSCLEQTVRDFAINKDAETDRRGGGMTVNKPVCICAYAYNQW